MKLGQNIGQGSVPVARIIDRGCICDRQEICPFLQEGLAVVHAFQRCQTEGSPNILL